MGKHLQHCSSALSIRNNSHNPGCMWGVLHMLKYHQHWRYIKKRLPHRKGTSGKHATGVGNRGHDGNALKDDGISQHENRKVEDKMTQSIPLTKTSVKSRLKALISEELYRRKGKHQRSSSCPSQSQVVRKDPIHHLEHSDEDPLPSVNLNAESSFIAMNLNDGSPIISGSKSISATSSQDTLVPNSSDDDNSEDSVNLVDETKNGMIGNYSILAENSDREKQNFVPAKELNMDASSCQSKEMLDALDMINMNKELFLKILQDPGSPLAHHFHCQQALSSKRAYSKSTSFSSPKSSHIKGSEPRKLKQKVKGLESNAVEPRYKEYIRSQSMPLVGAEYRRDGIPKLNQSMAGTADKSASGSAHHWKNPVVFKHFKDLKHKIRHVIKQSKKEKHRIIKDAFLHKIPHGLGFPKDMKCHSMRMDDKESPRSSYESSQSYSSMSKSEISCMHRTSSLSESLDRYCQLYESTFNREMKQPKCETLSLRTEDALPQLDVPKFMRRMLSSPNLQSYFSYTEASSDAYLSTQVRKALDSTSTRGDLSEQSDTESHVKSDAQQNSDSESYSANDQLGTTTVSDIDPDAKLGLVSDDLDNVETMDKASQDEQNTDLEEHNVVVVPISEFPEDATSPASISPSQYKDHIEEEDMMKLMINPPFLNEIEDGVAEIMIKDTPTVADSQHVLFQVGTKERAEFDYVKDILELSGFSGNEMLGTWHSDDQPVDPSLFEEMEESCMLLDPECSVNEEGYHCNNLLLFDLINEVLKEIFARSYTYYPMPISSLSHIRPMPVGYHVLEEVWANISWYLSSSPEADQLLDYTVGRDLTKNDGWMNLQFESECLGLEVEDLIFDDLLLEVICT